MARPDAVQGRAPGLGKSCTGDPCEMVKRLDSGYCPFPFAWQSMGCNAGTYHQHVYGWREACDASPCHADGAGRLHLYGMNRRAQGRRTLRIGPDRSDADVNRPEGWLPAW